LRAVVDKVIAGAATLRATSSGLVVLVRMALRLFVVVRATSATSAWGEIWDNGRLGVKEDWWITWERI